MTKEENVIRYYVLCNKLKNLVRTGWKDWHVEKDRLESVAEHIYSVQMLAIAMWSEYNYDIDITKVILMLAMHEIEEIGIGDLTHFEIEAEEKAKLGHEAVSKILGTLASGEALKNLILEFDAKETKEADFAYHCDKLECDLQAKLYEGYVDLNSQEGNVSYNDSVVQALLKDNNLWSDMWLKYGQGRYNYDKNFIDVSNYALNNDIKKLGKI